MPTSARPISTRSRRTAPCRPAGTRAMGARTTPTSRGNGFTLIEVLVVLVIMAVVIAFAVLSIGVTGRDSAIDEESRRIEGLIGLLQERAALEGHDYGLLVEPAAYQFVVYRPQHQRWERFDLEREFRLRELPAGLHFELQMDSRNIVIQPPDRSVKADAPQILPQIIIAASGEGTPFRLTVSRTGTANRASISCDAYGRLTLEASDRADRRT